ncbi:MAG: exo-alpha-sialidase [Firmicutes bacterium]|nr:exo-alpha-sialidase [Bacillota bacterium]
MKGKIAATLFLALAVSNSVYAGETAKLGEGIAILNFFEGQTEDIYKFAKGYVLKTQDGLLEQENKDTLSLAYPTGMENVTVWQATEESEHYCNGVCIAEFQGKLYCQWQSSAVDEDAPDTHICYAVSEDKGKSWSEAKKLPVNIEGGYTSSAGWYSTGDRLVAYINFWPDNISPRGGFTYYVDSADGESWSEPKPVTMADGTVLDAVFEQDPHVFPNGRIVNAAHFQKGLMVCPIYTDNKDGVTGWKKGNFTPTDSGDTSREMEPSLFQRKDGTLVMIFRDQDSSYTKKAAFSNDMGENWSEVTDTAVPDARTKQSAGNLSNGKAFMVGSPVDNKLRSPLAILLSDEGMLFDKAYLIRSDASDPEVVYEGKAKRKGFHYAKSFVYDGKVYVGYATNKEAVEIAIIPEESLE